ncbi:MAG: acyl-CoA dehydrogenase family protein [Lautropia sp.]
MPTDLASQLADARALLEDLRRAFEAATAAVARACSEQGRLSGRLLDRHQVSCFELAWVAADLLAAEDAIGASPTSDATRAEAQDRLEIQLALLFCVDAIDAMLPRLELIHLECDLATDALQAISNAPARTGLRRRAAGSAALAAIGQGVIARDAGVGNVALDEPLRLAQDAFRRFGESMVQPLAESIHREDLTVPESLLQPLREMGVFGLAIPERHGGSAPNDHDDTTMMVVVTEALSEYSLAAAGSLITRPEILSRALLAGGTPEQLSRWLPAIASGEPLCAIAITEPDYGSDVASLALRATRSGEDWILDGSKTWCTLAGKAGLLMVVARSEPDRSLGHRGLSVFLVEKPSFDTHSFDVHQAEGGRLSGRAIPTIGYRGMHSFELRFDRFRVPASHVIGGEAGLGKGFYYTMSGMMGGRMQTAARASGVMRAALRAAIRYCGDRKVFGAPLTTYPLTLAKLARMAARYAACRRLAYATASILDAGGGRMEASLVKLLACRSAEVVAREALQLHGGMGYAEESAVSRYFVDARVLSIFEGAEETLALKVVARGLLEQALARA